MKPSNLFPMQEPLHPFSHRVSAPSHASLPSLLYNACPRLPTLLLLILSVYVGTGFHEVRASYSSPDPMAAEHREKEREPQQRPVESLKGLIQEKGPSTSQVLAVVTLFPVGGILLALSGVTLTGTVIGLAVATPLFLLFSPVLIPAAIVLALAVTGFLASGAFGLTALSSLSWIFNYLSGVRQRAPEQMEQAKRRMAEAAGHVGPRGKDVGQTM